jgi:hypothetical protein
MKAMKQICQVLLFVSEHDGWITSKEICEGMNFNYDQIKAALRQLVIKQKLQRRTNKDGLNTYCYIDESIEPSPRPAHVKCSSPVAKLMEARQPVLSNFSRFAQKKIDVLERVINKVSVDDRDFIIGMINDYKSVMIKDVG